jgi:hypothetical protein
LLSELKGEVAEYNYIVYQTPEIKELYITLLKDTGIIYTIDEFKTELDQDYIRVYRFLYYTLKLYKERVGKLPFNIEPPYRGNK